MAMIKVKLPALAKSGVGNFNFRLLREMKQWCRENFGKNPRSGPQIWRSSTESEEDGSAYATSSWLRWVNRNVYPVFWFADQKMATAFLLRWG